MKRKLAIILPPIIIILAFWGVFRWTVYFDYISEQSIYAVTGKYKIILFICAVCFSAMVIIGTKNKVKKRLEDSTNRLFVWVRVLLFVIISPFSFFFLIAGLLLFSDMLIKNKNTLHINGIVTERTETHNSKGGIIHYLGIQDLTTKKDFRFKVRKSIFEKYKIRDLMIKDFEVSGLGIVYRKNE